MAKILMLSGPNLNLLGEREPHIYGKDTLDDCFETVRRVLEGHELSHVQSNHEGVLIDAVQEARNDTTAIIINPGALTHYSYALHDALAAFDGFKVEVHLSNPEARETWRHTSVIAPVVNARIAGLGRDGYRLAAEAVLAYLER